MRCPPLGVSGHVLLMVVLQMMQIELLSIRERAMGPKSAWALCSVGISRFAGRIRPGKVCKTIGTKGVLDSSSTGTTNTCGVTGIIIKKFMT